MSGAIRITRFRCAYDGMDVVHLECVDEIAGTPEERVTRTATAIGVGPVDAWREIILNAITHCDYDAEGGRVWVLTWPDAVAVFNHSRLRERTTIDALRIGAAPSVSPNPELQAQLRHLRSGGVAGAIATLAEAGLSVDIDTRHGVFRVTAKVVKR